MSGDFGGPASGTALEDDRADLRIDTVIVERGVRRKASVTLRGIACAGTTGILADEVQRLLRAGVDTMRFDLAGLRICTSDAVEQWIALSETLGRRGGSVSLTNDRGVVRRVLEAIGSPELAGEWS